MKTITGFYLLSTKREPSGANRVNYQILGDEVNINHAGFRKATADEIADLLELSKQQQALSAADELAAATNIPDMGKEDRTHLLRPFRVTLKEDRGDKFTIVFDCQAEDDDHAEEQAMNAYPDGEVVNITKLRDMGKEGE